GTAERLRRLALVEADDGVRTRDPQLGKSVERRMVKSQPRSEAESIPPGSVGNRSTRVTTGAQLARIHREPIAVNRRSAPVCVCYRVERPLAEPLEFVYATWLEGDAGTGDEVFDRAGDEYLSVPCLAGDSRSDVHGDPGRFSVDQLAFAGVKAGAN